MVQLLGDIAEVKMGYTFRSRLEADINGDVIVVQMKDIDELNRLSIDGMTRINMAEVKNRHFIQEGDLIFRSRGGVNLAALVDHKVDRAMLAAPMMLIRPFSSAIDPAFLQWFINQLVTQNILSSFSEGTAVKMISKSTLEKISVSVPPLIEQRKILEIARLANQEIKLINSILNRRKLLVDNILMHRAQKG